MPELPSDMLMRGIVLGLPLIAAVVAVLGWRRPGFVKAWTLGVLIIEGLALWTGGGAIAPDASALFLCALVTGAGLLAGLVQPIDRDAAPACARLLFFLGLGLGTLLSPVDGQVPQLLWIGGLLGVLVISCLGTMGIENRSTQISVGWLILGVASLVLQFTMDGAWDMAGLIWVVLLLPLVPFHHPFAAIMTQLPGAASLLLAVLLPILGYRGLLELLPALPVVVRETVAVVALLGIAISAAKVFHQYRLSQALVYAHIAQLGTLWWFTVTAGGTGTLHPQAGLHYLLAVSVVMFGLYVSALQVHDRFGALGLDQLRGLAGPMPRFATVFVLLVTAAMGLPLFATFAALMDMLLQTAVEFRPGVMVVLLGWLLASIYFPLLLHRLLFGVPRKDLAYRDLRPEETLAGALVLLTLVLVSVSPLSPLVALHNPESAAMIRIGGTPWNR